MSNDGKLFESTWMPFRNPEENFVEYCLDQNVDTVELNVETSRSSGGGVNPPVQNYKAVPVFEAETHDEQSIVYRGSAEKNWRDFVETGASATEFGYSVMHNSDKVNEIVDYLEENEISVRHGRVI